MYVITLQDLSYKQMHELNNKLVTFGSGVSATSVDDEGKSWRVSVTTGNNAYTQQVLSAITATLTQAVAVPYYTIDLLPSDVQKEVCQEAIDDNEYWDVWQEEREESFNAICGRLGLQWEQDIYDNYHVEEDSPTFYASDIKGARRVIAYIVNHWGVFKIPMYVNKDKHNTFHKLLNKKDAALPQKFLEDKLLTGYCVDYTFYEAFSAFVDYARQHPDTVTLSTFCRRLAATFTKEYEADWEQAHSIDYAMECLCNDKYYTWQGEDITNIVNKQLINK